MGELGGIQVATINRQDFPRGELAKLGWIHSRIITPSPPRDMMVVPLGEEYSLIPAVERRVYIAASGALEAPLGKHEFSEACGNIILINIEQRELPNLPPPDPPIPVSLIPLGGLYERALVLVVRKALEIGTVISDLERAVQDNSRVVSESTERFDLNRWYRQMRRRVALAVSALEVCGVANQRLTLVEHEYLIQNLELLMAWPNGKVV